MKQDKQIALVKCINNRIEIEYFTSRAKAKCAFDNILSAKSDRITYRADKGIDNAAFVLDNTEFVSIAVCEISPNHTIISCHNNIVMKTPGYITCRNIDSQKDWKKKYTHNLSVKKIENETDAIIIGKDCFGGRITIALA